MLSINDSKMSLTGNNQRFSVGDENEGLLAQNIIIADYILFIGSVGHNGIDVIVSV